MTFHHHHITHLAVGSLLISILFAVLGLRHAPESGAAFSTSPEETLWVSEGTSGKMIQADDGTVYLKIGDLVGPPNTAFLTLSDPITGENSAAAQPDSYVRAVVSDGGTGWYIGGNFNYVDGTAHKGLAHILADGSFDPTFSVTIDDGNVYNLAYSDGILYAGGTFTSVESTARQYFAAIDVGTNAVTGLDLSPDAQPDVLFLDGSTLYIGGFFTIIGGESRNGLAALDIDLGVISSFDAGLSAFDQVRAMAISGTTLYIGGNFSTVGLDARSYLAAVDTVTGLATAFDPSPDNTVYSLFLSGSTLYAGGPFSNIGGAERGGFAAINTADGTATSLNLPVTLGVIDTMNMVGDILYLGGNFELVNGESRLGTASIDTATGLLTTWAGAQEDDVYGIIYNGTTLLVGGRHFHSDTQIHAGANISTVNTSTGALDELALDPQISTGINDFEVSNSTLYVAGTSDLPQPYAVAYDTVTLDALPWNPDLNESVYDVEIDDSTVWLRGDFTTADADIHPYLVGVDAVTAVPIAPYNFGNAIQAFAVTDSALYVSGSTFSEEFRVYTDQTQLTWYSEPRSYFAAVDKDTGEILPLDLGLDAPPLVIREHNGIIYLLGSFTEVLGETRNGAAAFNETTGTLTSWNPNIEGFAGFETADILFADDSIFIINQNLNSDNSSTVGGEARTGLAEVDYATGAVTDWEIDFINRASRSGLITDEYLYLAGSFDGINNLPRPGLARFPLESASDSRTSGSTPGLHFASSITVTSPVLGDVLEGGKETTFSWRPNGRMDLASLSYSLDGGRAYIPIVTIRGSQEFYRWIPPSDVYTDHFVFRVEATDGSSIFARGESVPVSLVNDKPLTIIELHPVDGFEVLEERIQCVADSRFRAEAISPYKILVGDVLVPTRYDGINDLTRYYVSEDCTRHAFLSDDVFSQYFTEEEASHHIKIIDIDKISMLPLGENMPPRPGFSLIKFGYSSEIYAVFPGNVVSDQPVLRRFSSPEILTSLFGEEWPKFVIRLPEAQLADLTVGLPMTDTLTDVDKAMILTREEVELIDI